MKDRTFFVSVPADARFLRAIRSFFQPLLTEVFGDATTQMLILALDEACSNMIKHAGDGSAERRIEVHGELQDRGVRFRLPCFCGPSDVPNIKPRDLAKPAPGGLGTHFISRIMDRVQFEPDATAASKIALVMEKDLPDAKEPGDEA
jgi:sigma-B regulation protein RsbU (phosphoserine phosphatase)